MKIGKKVLAFKYLFAKHSLCNSLDEIYQYIVLIYFLVGDMRKDSGCILTHDFFIYVL